MIIITCRQFAEVNKTEYKGSNFGMLKTKQNQKFEVIKLKIIPKSVRQKYYD